MLGASGRASGGETKGKNLKTPKSVKCLASIAENPVPFLSKILKLIVIVEIAGDRSLADVIAHEIAHSWTGNLVTNSNFEHFWLNEGFTVFTEQKIVGRMKGEPARHFSAIMRWKDLVYSVMTVQGETNPLTALVVDLTGVDPDDAFSVVPYIKGSTFLWYLEHLVGGPCKQTF